MYFVYEIVGPTGVYVGKTNDFRVRWNRHRSDVNRGSTTKFHRAWRKYGEKAFSGSLILSTRCEVDAMFCERQVIEQHKRAGQTLYNLTDGGDGVSGLRQTPETCAKKSMVLKGKKRTPEQCRRISEAKKGRAAHPNALAALAIGRTPAAMEKQRKAMRSPEVFAKLSAAQKARWAKVRQLNLASSEARVENI